MIWLESVYWLMIVHALLLILGALWLVLVNPRISVLVFWLIPTTGTSSDVSAWLAVLKTIS